MSQFILCKSTENLENYNCTRLINCTENAKFLRKIASEIFRDDEMNDIWIVQGVDNLFTSVRRQHRIVPFEKTELYLLLSTLYDASEVIILWYGEFYQDLDYVNSKEQFLNQVQEGIYCPSGLCACYLRITNKQNRIES